jgi:hypothetical protein
MKFGLEIEFLIPEGGMSQEQKATQIANALNDEGIGCRWTGYTHALTHNWKIVTDGSVSYSRHWGFELVSPPMEDTPETYKKMHIVCETLVELGASIKRCCGLHVHVDASDLSFSDIKMILRRYQKFETAIDSFMPASRRGNNSTHTRSLSPHTFTDTSGRVERLLQDRYHKVNVQCYVTYGTVEFRHHSGTLSATKIIAWLGFIKGFIKASKEYVLQAQANDLPNPPISATDQDLVHELARKLRQSYSSKAPILAVKKYVDEIARRYALNPTINQTWNVEEMKRIMGTRTSQTYTRKIRDVSHFVRNSMIIKKLYNEFNADDFVLSYTGIRKDRAKFIAEVMKPALDKIFASHLTLTRIANLYRDPINSQIDYAIPYNDDVFKGLDVPTKNYFEERTYELSAA